MKTSTLLFLVICQLSVAAQQLRLSTSSDSAVHYYYEGWRQVMDEGNYASSEKAYRKMMTFDSNFLVGLSLLGRITSDLKERQQIESTLEQRKSEIGGDERLLLNTFIGLVKLTNLRETDPEGAKTQMETIFKSGEQNFLFLVHRYPDEIYYKAEYIEVLNRNHGSQVALDSLNVLASPEQQEQPFFLGYAAHLEAEVENFDNALRIANKLFEKVSQDKSPKPYVVYADIYFKMGNFEMAQTHINSALKLDPHNIDAQRLEKRIKEQPEQN